MAEKTHGEEHVLLDDLTDFRLEDMAPFFAQGVAAQGWWSLGVRLEEGTSLKELASREDAKGQLHVPKLYDDELPEPRTSDESFTIYARRDFINAANRGEDGIPIVDLSLGALVRPESIDFEPEARTEPRPPIVVPAGTVITAVIDNGIAFGHEVFRRGPTATRVAFAWVMDAAPAGVGTQHSTGRELTGADIDVALAASMQDGLLDDERFYRLVGLIKPSPGRIEPVAWRRSHGTHVMGLAAGAPMSEQVVDRPIICVDLPSRATIDPSGQDLSDDVRLALKFIAKRAQLFHLETPDGPAPPVAVNFSYGNFAGPHDGTGKIEQIVRRAIEGAAGLDLQVVLPSGNGNLRRCHGKTRFHSVGDEAALDWRVQPDDRSASYVEIWMPFKSDQPAAQPSAGLVEVVVTLPDGTQSAPVTTTLGSRAPLLTATGRRVGAVSYSYRSDRTRRGMIRVKLRPTTSFENPGETAPSGLYRIAIKSVTLSDGEPVWAWIRRDERLPGYPDFGRQSYFANACYQRFNDKGAPKAKDPANDTCILRRSGTLSGFASGAEPVVIGGYVRKSGRMADYSATGPGAPLRDGSDPVRIGPDASAASDDSVVLSGVLSAGSRSGSFVRMNGTSVAAPQAARWLADQLAQGLTVPAQQAVRQKGAAGNSKFPTSAPPDDRAGGGRMDLRFRFGPKDPA